MTIDYRIKMRRRSEKRWILFALCSTVIFAKADQKPQVNISFPYDETLIRANVPVFGSAYISRNQGKFRRWYLEYGPGRAPSQWTRIKESEKPVSYDPNADGKVVWNLNKEPTGNLTNWAVGLASYSYASWGKDLNGIYTLRLVAESENGEKAETRRTFYVGEAILRLYGGTGISADHKCRLAIPSFSFGGEQARVVVVVKQMPSRDFGRCKTVSGMEETAKSAEEIYQTTADEFQLLSAIYRIYPNGLKTDPASSLEIDFDPEEFSVPNTHPTQDSALLFQWNPVARLWEPLPTSWFGNTAKAEVQNLSEYATYVALMKRTRPVPVSNVAWDDVSALSGFWTGKTSPHTAVTVTAPDGHAAKCESDANGGFRLPFRLTPGFRPYRLEFLPMEGKTGVRTLDVVQKSGGIATPVSPILRILGDSTISVNNKLVILCQDASLSDSNVKEKRSVLAQVQTADYSKRFVVELAETVPGMGNFLGCILPGNARETPQEAATAVTSFFPPRLTNGERLTLSVGTASLNLKIKDTAPPKISLSSATHPCLLFATPESEQGLTTPQLHSQCGITLSKDAWKIGGIPGGGPSARIANWPVGPFPVSSWQFVGFTYKLYRQAPWQLILRCDEGIQSYHFACDGAWFGAYASAPPLVADGAWHDWQRNLTEGNAKRVYSIAFGSWLKTGFLRVEPAFMDPQRDSMLVKSLWVGRSYPDRLVEMAWHIADDSPLGTLDWWVDQDAESPGPGTAFPSNALAKSQPGTPDGKCLLKLPDDGKWFFHLRVADQAGNQSPVMSYPLIVYSTMGKNAALADRLLNQTETREVTWKQPEGRFQVKLEGFGNSLNPRTLVLRINGLPYRLAKPDWDPNAETLTIGAGSFADSIPLGVDKETLPGTLEGADVAGKPILNFPKLSIRIVSPFTWVPTSSGGELRPTSSNPGDPWIAFWKNPTPPWMAFFPDCVNNVLVLTKGKIKGQTSSHPPWQRPVTFVADGVQNIYWEENGYDPTAKQIPLNRTLDKTVFSADGSPANIPGRFAPRDPDKNAWVCMQTPLDPFQPATLRLISLQKGAETTLRRVTKEEASAVLNKQAKNTIRLDGWLPPGTGFIHLKAPGERDIQFASGADYSYRQTPTHEVKIEASDEWTRFSILITPSHRYKATEGGIINGYFYW